MTGTTVCTCILFVGFPHYPAHRFPDAMVHGSGGMISLLTLSNTPTDSRLIPSSASRSGESSDSRGAGSFKPPQAIGRQTPSFSRPAPVTPPMFRTGRASSHFLDRWHSGDYREPSGYRGRRVLVVGAELRGRDRGGSGRGRCRGLPVGTDAAQHHPARLPRRSQPTSGIALRRVPETVMNPLAMVLRRLSVPNLRVRTAGASR